MRQNCHMWHCIQSIMSLHMIGIQYLADSISVPGYPQSCPKEELQGKMQPTQQEPWPLDESGMRAAQTLLTSMLHIHAGQHRNCLGLEKNISYMTLWVYVHLISLETYKPHTTTVWPCCECLIPTTVNSVHLLVCVSTVSLRLFGCASSSRSWSLHILAKRQKQVSRPGKPVASRKLVSAKGIVASRSTYI